MKVGPKDERTEIRRATMKWLTIIAFSIIMFSFWNIPTAISQFSEAGVQKLKTPVDAADFTLKELGGREISLKELRGKVVVINFFTYS